MVNKPYRDLPPRDLCAKLFWPNVRKGGACWEWTAGHDSRGYGRLMIGQQSYLAHRISFWIEHGVIGARLMVCHICDNPNCVRPDHLFQGTSRDNMLDAVRKGRRRDRRGELAGPAKLTNAQAAEIRRRYAAGGVGYRQLAAEYGVTWPAIGYIIRRRTFAHLPTAEAVPNG